MITRFLCCAFAISILLTTPGCGVNTKNMDALNSTLQIRAKFYEGMKSVKDVKSCNAYVESIPSLMEEMKKSFVELYAFGKPNAATITEMKKIIEEQIKDEDRQTKLQLYKKLKELGYREDRISTISDALIEFESEFGKRFLGYLFDKQIK